MRDSTAGKLDSLTEQAFKDPRSSQAIVANQPKYSAETLKPKPANVNTSMGEKIEPINQSEKPFDLAVFSLSGKSKEMRSKMLADKYVMKNIAILGQATAIYAKPNTGKTLLTLHLLTEAIKSGDIKGENLFYINADDSFKGLVTKTELAEKYGFEMLAPGHDGLKSTQFLLYLRAMIQQETASGKIIVLDTLKKFTDLMDKKKASEFMTIAREFVANGGTLILLAHTNKNRDGDGKVVFAGTSDIVDDVDCAFTIDEVEITGATKRVLFENIKNRGDVAREVAYQYDITEKKDYLELISSVSELDGNSIQEAKKDKAIADKLAKNSEAIEAITEAINSGKTLKTDVVKAAHEFSGISKPKLTKALGEHTGSNFSNGDRWRISKGEKNAQSYHLVMPYSATSSEAYLNAKNGN
jgi:archaellum biogenesis ATPase FlaH